MAEAEVYSYFIVHPGERAAGIRSYDEKSISLRGAPVFLSNWGSGMWVLMR